MNQDQIKAMLLDIEESQLEFSVILTGKESKRVNGLYKPDTCEILLHNKNFTSDNQLVYTAIHEYAHHLLNEEKLEHSLGAKPGSYQRVHTNQFWARFHGLLEVAEQKGYYVIGLENSPELAALTEDIRKNYLEANGRLMQEFGLLLAKAHQSNFGKGLLGGEIPHLHRHVPHCRQCGHGPQGCTGGLQRCQHHPFHHHGGGRVPGPH